MRKKGRVKREKRRGRRRRRGGETKIGITVSNPRIVQREKLSGTSTHRCGVLICESERARQQTSSTKSKCRLCTV